LYIKHQDQHLIENREHDIYFNLYIQPMHVWYISLSGTTRFN